MLYSFSKNEEIISLCMEVDTIRKEAVALPMPYLFLRAMQSRRRKDTIDTLHTFGDVMGHTSHLRTTIDYNQVLEELLYNWSGFERAIQPHDIDDIIYSGLTANTTLPTLEKVLTYIQMSQDHPVIQGALLYLSVLSLIPDDPSRHVRAALVTRFRLATAGFDISGIDIFEEQLLATKNDYEHILMSMPSTDNATQWILYFISTIKKSLHNTSEFLLSQKRIFTANSLLLTPRQIKILSLFTDQSLQLSNREIREHFDLSPITIAREMATLVQNEYVIPIGKGRSVRYAKIV